MTSSRSTKSGALLLFAFVIVAWGLNWTVTKLIVTQVTPLWTTAIRTGIGALALFAMLAASKQFSIPRRGDVPVVLAISLFHLVAFAALITTGLKYVPVGRSIVLGYTTPLWVAPAALATAQGGSVGAAVDWDHDRARRPRDDVQPVGI
jgi:drug/metabolite transporter (DMT)-like permease